MLLTIITIIVSALIVNGQDKKGSIVDPDGYTNIRASADIKSEVVGKIMEGEVFKYKEDKSPWYPIQSYSGVNGFIHRSRIREFNIDRDFCFSSYYTELFLFRKNHKIFSVCGISAPEIKEFKVYSGLVVYDGLKEIKLLEFREDQYQSFEFIDGDIIVKEYATISTKEDFSPSFTPFAISKISFAGDRTVVQKSAPFYNYPRLTVTEVKTVIEEIKTKEIQERDYYYILDTALVLALNDKTIGADFLLNITDYINIIIDGEYAEKYMDVLMIYELNKNNR